LVVIYPGFPSFVQQTDVRMTYSIQIYNVANVSRLKNSGDIYNK
jgi:hypothetical protein